MKETKSKLIVCRVTPSDHARIKKAANSYGVNITEFVIGCAMAQATKRTAKLRDFDKDIKGGL